jgi:hypothetical protein
MYYYLCGEQYFVATPILPFGSPSISAYLLIDNIIILDRKKNKTEDRILQVEAIRCLLEQCPEILPIACGGGGIPVSRVPSNPQTLQGVEAVIDKDRCGGKLANELDADGYIILTDGGGIWQNFGKPNAREMSEFHDISCV